MKRRKIAAWFWYAMLWCPCFAISQVWFRYRFRGKSFVPLEGPVLLVSNHQSNLDPVLVGLACPRQLKYLARQGLFFWPFSLWIRSLGAVPIDRERGVLGAVAAPALDRPGGLERTGVEPARGDRQEGPRFAIRPGHLPEGVVAPAFERPVGLDGAYDALPRGSIFPRLADINLAFAPPITTRQIKEMTDEQLVGLVRERIIGALNPDTMCKCGRKV